MLILLPPSERKRRAADGASVRLDELSHPELASARSAIGDSLIAVSRRHDALRMLGVGASIAPEVAGNTTLWANPTAPAAQVYTGVLYDAAGASQWSAADMARAAQRVRIVSALWGAISPADLIPAYRLAMCVALPRVGALTALWRTELAQALDPLADSPLVVDCRSSDYAAAWKAPQHALTVRVVRVRDGRRTIASHTAKFARGLLAGALVRRATQPRTPQDLAEIAAALPGIAGVELTPTALTLVTP